MENSNSKHSEDCNDGELTKIVSKYVMKLMNEEDRDVRDDSSATNNFGDRFNGNGVIMGQDDKGTILEAKDYCENKKNKRSLKRISDNDNRDISQDKGDSIVSANSRSDIKLIGIIGQYLLSRVPLPTSRSDLQKKFTKSKDGPFPRKVDLDQILSSINDIFKSTLGLGIFGLDGSVGTTGNPKYYIVQLNNSKSYLDSIYQYGYINYKRIGELSPYQNETEDFLSPKLCNNFISFISFLFGFFSITSFVYNDEENEGDIHDTERDLNEKIEKINDDEIEISTGVLLHTGTLFTLVHCPSNIQNFVCRLNNVERVSSELDKLFIFKSKGQSQMQNDDSESYTFTENKQVKFSKISIILYVLFRAGYVVPVIKSKGNNVSYVSGFKNGPLLKWNASEISGIVKPYTKV